MRDSIIVLLLGILVRLTLILNMQLCLAKSVRRPIYILRKLCAPAKPGVGTSNESAFCHFVYAPMLSRSLLISFYHYKTIEIANMYTLFKSY